MVSGDNWTSGAISRASCSQIITTNEPASSCFTGRIPFLSPNQQCQSTEGKISHYMDLLTPSSLGGLPTFVSDLTTNSSWLPWGRVAMPLISPLMPVPRIAYCSLKFCFMPLNMQSATCIITSGPTSVLSITHDLIFCPRVVILAR